jgi:ABC-type dipeptide/oligopeptide/nickel transport system permease component
VTARAKGLGYTQIVVRHAFPNGLLPLITLVGIHIGTLMAGAFITENIFGWPGMGTLRTGGDQQQGLPGPPGICDGRRDHGSYGNLLADLAYGVADPRIRLE